MFQRQLLHLFRSAICFEILFIAFPATAGLEGSLDIPSDFSTLSRASRHHRHLQTFRRAQSAFFEDQEEPSPIIHRRQRKNHNTPEEDVSTPQPQAENAARAEPIRRALSAFLPEREETSPPVPRKKRKHSKHRDGEGTNAEAVERVVEANSQVENEQDEIAPTDFSGLLTRTIASQEEALPSEWFRHMPRETSLLFIHVRQEPLRSRSFRHPRKPPTLERAIRAAFEDEMTHDGEHRSLEAIGHSLLQTLQSLPGGHDTREAFVAFREFLEQHIDPTRFHDPDRSIRKALVHIFFLYVVGPTVSISHKEQRDFFKERLKHFYINLEGEYGLDASFPSDGPEPATETEWEPWIQIVDCLVEGPRQASE